MTELEDVLDRLESNLPDDQYVILAAAAAPIHFLAIHGCSANNYIKEIHKVRKIISDLRLKIRE